MCSKLTIKTPHQRHSDVVLVFLLLTINIFNTFFSVSIVELEQVNINWVSSLLLCSVLIRATFFRPLRADSTSALKARSGASSSKFS